MGGGPGGFGGPGPGGGGGPMDMNWLGDAREIVIARCRPLG
jgi:hypothetical protein